MKTIIILLIAFACVAHATVESTIDCREIKQKGELHYKAKEGEKEQHVIDFDQVTEPVLTSCVESIQTTITSNINRMKEIYDEIELEKTTVEDKKNEILQQLISKRKEIHNIKKTTKNYIIRSIQYNMVDTSIDCESKRMDVLVKVGEDIKVRVKKTIDQININIKKLEKEAGDLEDEWKNFEKDAKDCLNDKEKHTTEVNIKIQKVIEHVTIITKRIEVIKDRIKKFTKETSVSCRDSLKKFVDDAQAIISPKTAIAEGMTEFLKDNEAASDEELEDMFAGFDFRFSKIENIEQYSILDLNAHFRLCLIGKIINVELYYVEMMEPFHKENAKLKKIN